MARGVGRIGLAVAGLVVLVGAVGVAYAVGIIGVPTVAGVDNRFAGVNATTTLVETDLAVSNPNPVGVSLGGLSIDYTVRFNDVALATGSKHGLSVESGNSTVSFTTAVANERIPRWWVSHLRNAEHTTVRVEANVTSGVLGRSVAVTPVEQSVDTDLLSAFNSTEPRPVDANSPLVSDPVLWINETRASWGDVSTRTTPIDLAIVVYNPKAVPYTITKVSYTVTMNDIEVGAGETARGYTIPPHAERTLEGALKIRNGRLDEWWVSHLERDQVTALRIEFSATVELASGQTVQVPLDQLTYTETIETDFFGNEAGGRTSDGSNPTATAAPAAGSSRTPTAQAETSTATSGDDGTPTATTVPTPTPTPTPDNGLPIGNGTSTDVL